MTGSLGDLTFYKKKDTGETIARMKHGPSRKQIMNDPRYEKLRLNGVEFAGRVRGGQLIVRALGPLRRIVKPYFSQSLHKPLSAIQVRDTKNKLGQRRISFSKHPVMLEGLTLNTGKDFAAMIYASIQCSISKTGETTVQMPELIPGISYRLNSSAPYFRIHAVLGAVPDLHLRNGKYASVVPGLSNPSVSESTPWLHTGSTIAPYTFHLVPKVVPAAKHFVWMLSVGIEFGFPITAYDIEPTLAQAAGKVLRVVSGGNAVEKSDIM